jgi:hypothetical protein
MLRWVAPAALTAVVLVLMSPSEASAYGAAYRGRTVVGPNGAYHSSRAAVSGAGGGWAVGGRSTAVGYGGAATRSGAVYHSGSVGYGQYPNTTTYRSGGAAVTRSGSDYQKSNLRSSWRKQC